MVQNEGFRVYIKMYKNMVYRSAAYGREAYLNTRVSDNFWPRGDAGTGDGQFRNRKRKRDGI